MTGKSHDYTRQDSSTRMQTLAGNRKMGWDKRRYQTRSKKMNGRVVREYVRKVSWPRNWTHSTASDGKPPERLGEQS